MKWTPRRESEGDSRMTSSPPQGLAPVTTVHEETRAASGGAALTQQAEEANAVGTEEFATNRRGGKRKRDATQYYRLLSDERKRSIPKVHRVLEKNLSFFPDDEYENATSFNRNASDVDYGHNCSECARNWDYNSAGK